LAPISPFSQWSTQSCSKPLAYPDAERIVSVETLLTNTGRAGLDVSGPDFLDWQAQNKVFDVMAHYAGEEGVAIVVGDRAEFANDMDVSTDFFTVFGQTASAGRLLTDRDVPTGGAPSTVAVVRRQWAESHFGSAEAAIGKTITVYGLPRRIVGVAARGFSYPGVTDIWSPAPAQRVFERAIDRQYKADLDYTTGVFRPIGWAVDRTRRRSEKDSRAAWRSRRRKRRVCGSNV
jgi:hypothetical protein